MLGTTLDYLYVAFENRIGEIPEEVQHIQRDENDSERWICFLPEGVLKFSYVRNKILSGKNSDVYVIPKTAIQPNPEITRELLEKIIGMSISNRFKQPEGILNVLGISLGNAPAYLFANFFPVNRFVSVVPGSLLPECIWESIATREITEGSGKTLDDYREVLNDFSPLRNLNSLKVDSLEVYLGKCDKMIPYERGRELVDRMEKIGLKPRTKVLPFSGHCETIFYFTKDFAISQ